MLLMISSLYFLSEAIRIHDDASENNVTHGNPLPDVSR